MNFLLMFFIGCFHLQIIHSANIDGYKSYKNYKLYEVRGDRDSLRRMIKILKEIDETLIYDQVRSAKTVLQVIVAPDLIPVFEEVVATEHLKAQVIYEDFSQIILQEKNALNSLRSKEFSWTAYYDIEDIYGYVQNMSKTYSNWTKAIVAGESYEGRPILGLRINTPTQKNGDKPVIFIESGIHAREWITPATTTYFINQLLTSDDPDITALRDQFDWRIFPTVNPDGYHYSYTTDRMWRKTRSKSPNGCYGADPNRNWDYNWLQHGANSNPCDYQVYAGSHPFSEKETRNLAAYVSSIENLLGYIAFHSTAQTLLLPYSDSVQRVDNYDDLVQIGKRSLEYGYKVNNAKYDGPGTAAEILYSVSGGSMDWVRHNLSTPLVFTYELRGYYFHWPPARIYEQGDEVTQMMLGFAAEARNLGYF